MAAPKSKSLAEKSKSTKNLAAAERVKAATIGAGEPIITLENYNVDFANAFSYYNTYGEDKERRKWVQKYLAKDKASLEKLADVSDFEIRQLGIMIRLADRGQPLRPEHTSFINTKLDAILNRKKVVSQLSPEKSNATKPIVSIADRIDAIATNHIDDIEGEIDAFIVSKKSDFSMKTYVEKNQINAPTAKVIGGWFKKRLPELTEAIHMNDSKNVSTDEDEQLVEAYSHFSKAQLKKFKDFVASIVEACEQQKVKVIQKVRKVKVKPPTEVVKRVKYMPEFEELNLKSEHPVKLVGATEVWLYSTKYRRVTVLKSLEGEPLIVKGTSIVNFDVGKSDSRTLRKPEDFFKTKLTKRDLAAAWKALKTKASAAKGRINEETIILAAFI